MANNFLYRLCRYPYIQREHAHCLDAVVKAMNPRFQLSRSQTRKLVRSPLFNSVGESAEDLVLWYARIIQTLVRIYAEDPFNEEVWIAEHADPDIQKVVRLLVDPFQTWESLISGPDSQPQHELRRYLIQPPNTTLTEQLRICEAVRDALQETCNELEEQVAEMQTQLLSVNARSQKLTCRLCSYAGEHASLMEGMRFALVNRLPMSGYAGREYVAPVPFHYRKSFRESWESLAKRGATRARGQVRKALEVLSTRGFEGSSASLHHRRLPLIPAKFEGVVRTGDMVSSVDRGILRLLWYVGSHGCYSFVAIARHQDVWPSCKGKKQA